MSLANSTMIMSGGSRGIGEAIAVKAARDGANVALLAKTTEPHPNLPGTIYTAAAAIEAAGGHALPLVGDIRDDEFVQSAVAQTSEQFGGIDIVVNNASAIDLSRTEDIRPDDADQFAWRFLAFQTVRPASPSRREPAYSHLVAPDLDRPEMVRNVHGLFHR